MPLRQRSDLFEACMTALYESEWSSVACPVCGAGPGEPCQRMRVAVHSEREDVAAVCAVLDRVAIALTE